MCTCIQTHMYVAEYLCSISLQLFSLTGGPPSNISDINIPENTITACGFVVQWTRPSSDPVCGTVWYTVTILTEGGMMIITDNTTLTNYNVTGLNTTVTYNVSVIGSNNAGSSSPTSVMIMTNNNGEFIVTYAYMYIYIYACIRILA